MKGTEWEESSVVARARAFPLSWARPWEALMGRALELMKESPSGSL